VFLEDYDMVIARYLVQGVDVWLNTPRRPLEASGTSGMKAAMNGVLNLSVLDGWWAEAYRRDVGWAIGLGEEYTDEQMQDYIESNATYEMLEKDLIPTFYDRGSDGSPRGWIMRMKAALRELCPVYTMDRVVQEYTRRFYHPALEHSRRLSADGYQEGRAFAGWQLHLQGNWDTLKAESVTTGFDPRFDARVGEAIRFSAEVYLDAIGPDQVSVQLYEGAVNSDGEITRGHAHDMTLVEEIRRKEKGWFRYEVEVIPEVTGQHGYTVRIVPQHPDLRHPLRLGLIAWA
jgi:starch phosphorylase